MMTPQETQNMLQDYMMQALQEDLEPKGLNIDRVLIRSITLPPFIMSAIEKKKDNRMKTQEGIVFATDGIVFSGIVFGQDGIVFDHDGIVFA